jgi:predicted nuclease with TOPRIM domain
MMNCSEMDQSYEEFEAFEAQYEEFE